MCEMCKENGENGDDGPEGCQFCGQPICFDVRGNGDYISQAVVMESGDLACLRCSERIEQEEAVEAFLWESGDWFER